MTKAIFVAMFLGMCCGAPPLARAEMTSVPDRNATVTLFMDTNDVVACTSSVVPMDTEGLIFEMNPDVTMMKMDTSPATVACGSTNDAIATTSTVNMDEAKNLYGGMLMTMAQKDDVGTYHLICHRASKVNLTPATCAWHHNASTLGNNSVANFVWTSCSTSAPAWVLFQGAASSALLARDDAFIHDALDACAANLA